MYVQLWVYTYNCNSATDENMIFPELSIFCLSFWITENMLIFSKSLLMAHFLIFTQFLQIRSAELTQVKWACSWAFRDVFICIFMCICLYMYMHTHTRKKLLINRYPKFNCKKLSVHQEKVTAGAQEKETVVKKLLQWGYQGKRYTLYLKFFLWKFLGWTGAF